MSNWIPILMTLLILYAGILVLTMSLRYLVRPYQQPSMLQVFLYLDLGLLCTPLFLQRYPLYVLDSLERQQITYLTILGTSNGFTEFALKDF